MTEGEHRVGINFNPSGDDPSGDDDVNTIKLAVADLIDNIELKGRDKRCTSLAQTAFEEGAMWAVKSITKKARDND